MKLKFTRDFIGRETAMQEYKAGDVVDIPNAQALELVKLGAAEEVLEESVKVYEPPQVEKPRKGKKK